MKSPASSRQTPLFRLTLTGARGRLAELMRGHFAAPDFRVLSLSRSEGGDYLGLENLFVNNILDQTDTLMHLAWSTLPYSAERNVGLEWEQDIPLLVRLLKTIVESGRVQRVHFIFFSSGGAVYGPARDGTPSREDDPCRPIGWYGHAKLCAERIIEEFGRRYGLIYTILRVSNPYGFPIPFHKPQGVIPFLLRSARDGVPCSIWGDGNARKDFIHYTDFLRGVEAVVRQRPVGVFNLCFGESRTINEVIAIVSAVTGTKLTTINAPAHHWDVSESLLSNRKLCEAVNWHPQISLTEGIKLAAKLI